MKFPGRLDPLVLFLVAGLALYLLLDALGLARGDDSVIAVDEAGLNAYLASEGGQLPGRSVAGMSPGERRELIERYIRDEALTREARALGLEREDPAIRRRLVQSMRFSLQADEGANATEPTDEELRQFHASHRERYGAGEQLSFSHVFFDADRRGPDQAHAAARQALAQLGKEADWLALGDRYPYQRAQVDVSRDALAAELGKDAAIRIFAMSPGNRWQGPLGSKLGVHLVRVERKSAGSDPDIAALRSELAAGLAAQRREDRLQRAIDGIVAGYRVKLSPALEQGSR